jgi:hypothetical protein
LLDGVLQTLHRNTQIITVVLAFRSVILTSLLFLWLPFGVAKDTMADIWHILLKWNQYVREYERSSLHQAVKGARSPFADVSAPTSELNCHSMAGGDLSKLPTLAGEFTVRFASKSQLVS